MRITLGADHAGWELKSAIAVWLQEKAIDCQDLSAAKPDPQDDYPDIAAEVARAVVRGDSEFGILVCGTGVGTCIVANKIPGARAALCADAVCAEYSRLHNDANILCLGGRLLDRATALQIVETWLNTPFSGELRHRRRLEKIARLERTGDRR